MSNTRVVIFGLFITAALYDLYAVWFGGVDASISQAMTNLVGNHPFLMFVCGMLVSHFFGFVMQREENREQNK
jgi:putative Ca2+/H+ antiporter (TMEM165/GDT1 family)